MPTNSDASEPEDLLYPAEVEQRLRISADTRRRYAKSGVLPRVIVGGGAVRYRRSDVDRVAAGNGGK